jgi:transposase
VEAALAELDAALEDAFVPSARHLQPLRTIPGVGLRVAQVIIAETGADMSRFPSAAHLAAWAGVAPAIHESAGKRSPAGARHGNTWLDHMLVEAAGSVAWVKGANHLSAQHARLTARCGMGRAQVAVAHSILVSAYHMLRDDEPYRELGADWLARRTTEAHTRRPVPQLEHLGHTVILDPVT